jgi:hypothetical protein
VDTTPGSTSSSPSKNPATASGVRRISQDLLISVTADLEKQYWMFQAEHQ